MPYCRKVRNPCKICLQPVNARTGIQCRGHCQSWVHYDCVNYTPGRIHDIRHKIITVTCPCPDCRAVSPKEVVNKESYSCNSVRCPANNPPACDQPKCTINTLDEHSRRPGADLLRDEGYSCGKMCKQYSNEPMPELPEDVRARVEYERSKRVCRPESAHIHRPCGKPHDENTVRNLCDTVGNLTKQINELMVRMCPDKGTTVQMVDGMDRFNDFGTGVGGEFNHAATGNETPPNAGSEKDCSGNSSTPCCCAENPLRRWDDTE